MLWYNRSASRVHKKKTPRTICILNFTCIKTALPKKCRLLVACRTCYRNTSCHNRTIRITIYTAWWLNLWKHWLWYIKLFYKLIIPAQLMYIKEHSSWSVSIISYMHCSSRKLPYKPCINCPEKQLSFHCSFSCALHIIKYPCYLGRTKVSIRNKPCLCLYNISITISYERLHVLCCSTALPYYCIVYRLSCLLVPYNSCFSLIGYSYASYILGFSTW